MAELEGARELVFFVNGRKVVLETFDPLTLLVDYLRSADVGLTGTKKSCGQGGCGACTVMLSTYDASRDALEHAAINSCLRPLGSLDGAAITTIEGVGNVETGLSPVQHRLAAYNGSQCGFCSPGFVMNMHAFLASHEDSDFGPLEVEDAFDGNLCRCTGFRPILDAMKSFASDEGGPPPCDVTGGPPTKSGATAPSFPDELRREARALAFENGRLRWYRPLGLAALYRLLETHADSSKLRIVAGHTSYGVYPEELAGVDVVVDISKIEELKRVEVDEHELSFGAGVTYDELADVLDRALDEAGSSAREGLAALRYMVGRTAGTLVRNAATIGGNTILVAAHVRKGEPFPSDLFTALCALRVQIDVGAPEWREPVRMPALELAKQYADDEHFRRRSVLLAYHVPPTRDREYTRTYKLALRHEDAHALVNAGLRAHVDESGTVRDAALVFGGVGPIAFHAREAESFLVGREWNADTLEGALVALGKDLDSEIRSHRERAASLPYSGISDAYRRELALSFFYQFFVHVALEIDPDGVPADVRSAGIRFERPVSGGKQVIPPTTQQAPVGRSVVKIGAWEQVSGEAVYTHDIPLPVRGVEAAFVLSECALGTFFFRVPEDNGGFRRCDVDELVTYLKATFDGVLDLLTARDVAPDRLLLGIGKDEPIFSDGAVAWFGQPIGLIVAEGEQNAIDVAAFVQATCVGYEALEMGQEPILSISQARAKDSYLTDHPPTNPGLTHIHTIERPGSDLGWVHAKGHAVVDGVECIVTVGSLATGAQAHFYMESNACVVTPLEGKKLKVQASTQDTALIQQTVAATLGLPTNRIEVDVRRLGGAYGAKGDRSPFVAVPVALAAWKHRRPVKLIMPRDEDTAMTGKRHPFLGEYRIAVAAGGGDESLRGRILGLHTDFYLDAGYTYDASFTVSNCAQLRGDTAYNVPSYRTSSRVCRTNKASNTAMRSMGMMQAVLIQEDAVEAAAHAVGLLPELVRPKSFYRLGDKTPWGETLRYCYLSEVWDRLSSTARFFEREADVRAFNEKNRWRKRGISMVPLKYGMGYNLGYLTQGGALVNVFTGDGTVLVYQGGVEMGQGVLTKIAQIAAEALDLPLSRIALAETTPDVIPNPTATGASSGTVLNGAAVRQAALELRERLEDFCQASRQWMGTEWAREQHLNYWDYADGWKATIEVNGEPKLLWDAIIALAYEHRVDLSSHALYRDDSLVDLETEQFVGFTYSAACSEVEIDVLTGDTTILRSDILYDAGNSLNPAIDVGQIEGAFVQGIGNVLTEELVYQPDGDHRGKLNTLNTWTYKPPGAKTIPIELNVDLFPRDAAANVPVNPNLLLSAKEVGEPPLVLATTVYFAVKHAVLAARRDRGHDAWFRLDSPATVERVRRACLVDAKDLKM